ncbi:MAG: hypothetical protein PHR68_02105 [Candidatus Gracilibacteria bacterium]|nr:hypothetical protein [Candidatus Gracilibacteria bacterium]
MENIENQEIQKQQNQEAFKKEFGKDMKGLNQDEQNLLGEMGNNFDSNSKDLKGAFNKTIDDKVNKNLSNLGEEDKNKLKSLKEGMLKNPNDLKEIAGILAEINSIIGTDVAENSRQAKDYQANQEQSSKQNSELQKFKDEFSKMLNKSSELIKQNQDKAKKVNLASKNEQEKSGAEAEKNLIELWPDSKPKEA